MQRIALDYMVLSEELFGALMDWNGWGNLRVELREREVTPTLKCDGSAYRLLRNHFTRILIGTWREYVSIFSIYLIFH